MTIRKILVAHDFSEASNRALRFAADLARQARAGLEIVYVYPDIYDGRGDPALILPDAPPGQGERYLHFLGEELQRAAQAVLGTAFDATKCHVVRGDPVKRIEHLATELDADVVCLGATGKGAVQRVLLGSVSQLVLRSSPGSVLIVP